MPSTHIHAPGVAGRDSADALAARQSWQLLWGATHGKRLLMSAGIGLIIAQAGAVLVLPWLAGSVAESFTTRAGAVPALMLALGVFAAMACWAWDGASSFVPWGKRSAPAWTESIHDRLMSLRWAGTRTADGAIARVIARDVPAAVNGPWCVPGIPAAMGPGQARSC